MRRAKRTVVILGLALAGCQGPVILPVTITPQIVPVRILATTATYPLLQEFVAEYHAPETLLAVDSAVVNWETIQARLLVESDPASGAFDDPAAAANLYALTSAHPSDIAPSLALWSAPLGEDGIAILVHPTNPISALTLDDLRLIMAGEIANWATVGGPDVPVAVVSREAGSATRLAFDALVMAGQQPVGGARLALSSARVVEIVARLPGSIGYVSMGWLRDQAHHTEVRVVPLATDADSSAVLPDPTTVSAETYPLHMPVRVVGLVPPEPGSAIYNWFAWMQSGAGQQIVGRRYGSFSP